MTGNRGMIGGWRFWLFRTLRYLAIFLDGSKRSCRSPNSFSYLLGSFSHVPLSLETGAKFKPLWGEDRQQSFSRSGTLAENRRQRREAARLT